MRRSTGIGLLVLLVLILAALMLWVGVAEENREDAPDNATSRTDQDTARLRTKASTPDMPEVPPTRVRICGRVVTDEPLPSGGLITASVARPGGSEPTQAARIATDGSWELDVTGGAPLRIAATVPGLPATSLAIADPKPCHRYVYALELASGPTTTVTGTVSDVFGGPLAGAWVDVIPTSLHSGRGYEQPVFRTLSDEAGRFAVMLAPSEVAVRASFPGYATAVVGADTRRRRRVEVSLALDPGATISGQVVRVEDGAPVPGAELRIVALGRRPDAFVHYTAPADAVADAEGRFVLDDIGYGSWAVYANSDAAISTAPVEVAVDLFEDIRGVIVPVESAARVSGAVLERGSEEPVAGAVVMLHGDSRTIACSVSDAEGQFECGGVPPGAYNAIVDHDDYAGSLLAAAVQVGHEPKTLTLEVQRGYTIAGRVTPAAPGIAVRVRMSPDAIGLLDAGYMLMNAFRTAETNAAGEFEIGPLTLGQVTLVAEHLDHGRAEAIVDEPLAKSGATVELALQSGAVLVGEVTSDRATPVGGLDLVLTPVGEPQRVDGTRQPGSAKYSIPVGDDGELEARGLEAGTYALRLDRPGGSVGHAGPEQVVLADGETARVSLQLTSAPQAFAGTVVDTEGSPVDGAVVALLDDPHAKVLTDERGASPSRPGQTRQSRNCAITEPGSRPPPPRRPSRPASAFASSSPRSPG